MNVALWTLQVLAALLYLASAIMKVFLFDQVSRDVRSFGALPKRVWQGLGIFEFVCATGLILPAAISWHPNWTSFAALGLAVESLVFIGVHVKYREIPPVIFCAVLGLLMAFIAYGRVYLAPIP